MNSPNSMKYTENTIMKKMCFFNLLSLHQCKFAPPKISYVKFFFKKLFSFLCFSLLKNCCLLLPLHFSGNFTPKNIRYKLCLREKRVHWDNF